jgi:hypothetical protein
MVDMPTDRMYRDAYAAAAGQRAGRMLSVTAYRLPGPGSSLTLVGVALLAVFGVLAARRLSRSV